MHNFVAGHVDHQTIHQLILATASSFRINLLRSTGLQFEARAAHVDEQAILGGSPEETALARARAKAQALAESCPGALVIGADQVVGLGHMALGKVSSPQEAEAQLAQLQGRTHYLYSAVQLCWISPDKGPRRASHFVTAVEMRMRPLTPAEISAYVATGEWQGCAGCYQVENRGIHLFETLGGDHTAIVGLPLVPLLQHLRFFGINGLLQPGPPWYLSNENKAMRTEVDSL